MFQRLSCTAIVASLLLITLPPSTAATASAEHAPRGAFSDMSSRTSARLDVHETARSKTGHRLRDADLRMTISSGARFPRTIARTHTRDSGRFHLHLHLRRTTALGRFARYHDGMLSGQSFTTSGSFGIPGATLTLSTRNSSTNSHHWTFPKRSRTPADFYWLSGSDGDWLDAPDVYAGAHYPHGH